MFDGKMPMPMKKMGATKALPMPEGSKEEESMEDPNYEMEEDKGMAEMLQGVSDEELLAELKKRGLSLESSAAPTEAVPA
jgi:hypothetical protein